MSGSDCPEERPLTLHESAHALRRLRVHVLQTTRILRRRYVHDEHIAGVLNTLHDRILEPFINNINVLFGSLFHAVFLRRIVASVPWTIELACLRLALLDVLDHMLLLACEFPHTVATYAKGLACHLDDLAPVARQTLLECRKVTQTPAVPLYSIVPEELACCHNRCICLLRRLQESLEPYMLAVERRLPGSTQRSGGEDTPSMPLTLWQHTRATTQCVCST